MKNQETKATRCFVAALAMTVAGGAFIDSAVAQQPPAQAQHPTAPKPATPPRPAPTTTPATDTPQQTTATYGDWVVQCVARPNGDPGEACDMAQVTQAQVQGKSVPFSRVAIGLAEKGQLPKLVVQVPVNVSFATNVHIQTADDDPGMIAPFANCSPNGCFAIFELKDELLKKLRTAASTGKVSFADSGAHDISVPLSFNGFAQAYDALAKK